MLSAYAELAESKAHEARVAAFLASVPKRKRERVLAKYEVLSERQLRKVAEHESSWAGDVLDELLVATEGIGACSVPEGSATGRLRRTPAALGLGGRVFSDELSNDGHRNRPGDAAIWRPPETLATPAPAQ